MMRCYAPKVERLEDRCVPTADPMSTPMSSPLSYSVVHDHTLTATNDGVLANATDPTLKVTAVNGAMLMVRCPFCGFANEDGALFCEQCKSDLSSVPTSPISLPSGATLSMDDHGHFLYTPTAHAAYADLFSFTLSDNSIGTAAISVTDQAPTAPSSAYSVVHDHTLTATSNGVLANAADADGDPVHVTAVNGMMLMVKCPFCHFDNEDGALFCEQCKSDLSSVPTSPISLPSGGVLNIDADGHFVYTPAPHSAYTELFSFTLSDGATSSVATVTIDVTDQAAVAPNVVYNVAHDTTLTATTDGVLANATDADGDSLRVSAVNGAAFMVICPFCHYANEDGALFCEQCKSDISSVPPPPIMLPSGATLTMDDDGCLVYNPVANSVYTEVFTYTIWDGATASIGTVTINVTA